MPIDDTPHAEEVVQPLWREEFAPGAADDALASFNRRDFLKLTTAAAALAGSLSALGGCTKPQPPEKIVPYVGAPEGLIPGVPLFFASALPLDGWGYGVIVEQHEGRPTKIEGNPDHPSTLGGTNIFMQASILQLYDPDRSRAVLKMGSPDSWSNLVGELRSFLQAHPTPRVRILTPTVTSPSIAAQIDALRRRFPGLRWHRHDGAGMANRTAGLATAAGKSTLTPVYDFTRARRVLSLDSHFLADEPGSVRYAREFIQGRRVPFKPFGPHETHRIANAPAPTRSADDMLRLYMVESTLTFTGAMADHRLARKAGDIPRLAAQIARALRGQSPTGEDAAWIRAVADDLRSAGPAALVLAGETQPPEVHALAHALNAQLQSAAVRYVERVDFVDTENPGDSLLALTRDLSAGNVDLLLILDCNPVYSAPADIPFADALTAHSQRGGLSVSLALYDDETAGYCRWHVPLSHPLEAWGDVRGHDGATSLVQPLIQPLWASKSALEFLAAVNALGPQPTSGGGAQGIDAVSAADLYADGFDLLRRHWFSTWQGANGEKEMRWRKALKDGLIADSAAKEVPNLAATFQAALDPALAAIDNRRRPAALEINFRPDPALGDGAWANHPWLQELPKPLTRLTWDNVLLVSPKTARDLHLADTAEHTMRKPQPTAAVTVNDTTLELPVWVQPGQPDDTLTVYLGGGRTRGGLIQEGVGVNVNAVRTTHATWFTDAKVAPSEKDHPLACTQNTQVQSEREIVKTRDVADLPHTHGLHAPDLYGTQTDKDGKQTVHLSLYDENRYTGYKWGMVIDLTACIGCNACVIACQSENNIPTVGKDQVLKGREMHWLRIDAYYGDKETMSLDAPEASEKILFQPMLCQHCEDAPCEVVCPVEATSHSDEGLNEMTYNRCVGTRYCSNNCPYKVRRFNFLQYNDHDKPTLAMQKNPNVTVRSRGVMEKCTYSVQRLNAARIDAKRDWAKNDREHKPTDMRATPQDEWAPPKQLPRLSVMTACQQSCPTEAIIFGDLNDKDTHAAILKSQPPYASIAYGVLTELNTQPRTSYMERLTNKNPALAHYAATAPSTTEGSRQ
jgi:molybdopterin-containing oxidoreductase family iron-sulfur binding subunit